MGENVRSRDYQRRDSKHKPIYTKGFIRFNFRTRSYPTLATINYQMSNFNQKPTLVVSSISQTNKKQDSILFN